MSVAVPRAGQEPISGLMIAIISFLLLVEAFGVAFFGATVVEKTGGTASEAFRENAIAVDVLGAPCATKHRGVFYLSAVRAGDLNCLEPENSVHVQFQLTERNTVYTWTVERQQNGQVSVVTPTVQAVFRNTYRILVYDKRTGTYEKAKVLVGS